MSAESGAGQPEARRSTAGNFAFGAGAFLTLATATLGAFAAVALLGRTVDPGPLSGVAPGHGHNALVVGGIAVGGLGWILPAQLTTVAAVFAIGFGWVPPALVPWERFGPGDGFGKLKPSASRRAK